MINLKLANILTAIAEIKKSSPDDKNILLGLIIAARTLRDNPESIEKIYSSGKLRELTGMEEPAYKLIKEYLDTGSIGLYEELKSKYSENLIRLVRISGLGKKRMFKIYDTFNIKSLEDLKDKLVDNNRIANVLAEGGSGKNKAGESYTERLKQSLDYMESIRGMFPRWQVELYLDEIKNSLYKIKDIKRFVFVGSLRRKKSIVKDIDILIQPYFNNPLYDFERSEKLLGEIRSLNFIKRLLSSDIRKENISARFETVFGIEIEFIISSAKNWAVDMLYTTGSKKHIKKLERIAQKKGYFKSGRIETAGFSENSGEGTGNYLPADDAFYEKNIYSRLNLQYIPPELREDLGEIELAENFLVPSLLTMEDIKGDLHIHSRWSDGIISLHDMVERVKKFNYEYIAITDHTESNYYGRGLDAKRVQEKINYINKLKSRFKDFYILMGSEIEIRGVGKLDYPENIIKKMDIAIGSMHSSFLNTRAENTARTVSAIENRHIDFIAHPTGVVFGNRAPYSIDIDRLISAAAKNNKALEINSYFLRMDLNEQDVRKAREMGVKVVINTDAHRPNNMDMVRLGVDVARRAGLQKKDVLNALTLKELKAWKKQRS
ncbi:MAG: PHP domain-containing protein [Actinobacteria bacterium]|nr:MAG: PHP domain-containing protein [Actinomycetota bacterium]